MLTCGNKDCREGKWQDGYCTDPIILACFVRVPPPIVGPFRQLDTPEDFKQAHERTFGRLPLEGIKEHQTPFNYKDGEDYTCALCGELKHTLGPRHDKLCDGCWELKTRIKMQPDLARKVIRDLEFKEVLE